MRFARSNSLLQLAFDTFQGGPAWIADLRLAFAGTLVQILAALRAQALAIFAAQHLCRQRQQDLLFQHIFQLNAITLVKTDLSLGLGDRRLIRMRIGIDRPVQQIEIAAYIVLHRLYAPGAGQLDLRLQLAAQPDIRDYALPLD